MTIKTCETIRPDFEKVEEYLKDSYSSGQLSNWGPCFTKLRNRLWQKLGLEEPRLVVPVSSGHIALMAAYAGLEIKRPLMPAYTFPSTYCAATLQGIKPKLVDVSLRSGCLELDNIKDVSLDEYDSVVTVCGLSTIPDLDALQRFCTENNKKLIIDGAATFGTQNIAQYGDAFCMSLHATKSLPVGEGGLLVMERGKNLERANHFLGFGLDQGKNIVMSGLNGKMSEYTAAITLSILDKLSPYIQSRLLKYFFLKCDLPRTYSFPESYKGSDTVYQFAPVFMHTKKQAVEARAKLKEAGIPNLQYYKPLLGEFWNAEFLYERNICLPIHSEIEMKTLETMTHILSTVEPSSSQEIPASSCPPYQGGSPSSSL